MSELNFTHSNGNKVKLTTPDTLAANRTFKLPGVDGSAGQVLQTDGNGNLSWTTIVPGGITMADQWRWSTFTALSNNDYYMTNDSHWERVDSGGQGTLNGGMTQSGGIFTFPSTGIYKVEWEGYFEDTGSADTVTMGIYATTNNSSYSRIAQRVSSVNDVSGSTYAYDSVHVQSLVDVTDTSNVKVKFRVSSGGSVSFDGSSSENRNCATFIRIGDT